MTKTLAAFILALSVLLAACTDDGGPIGIVKNNKFDNCSTKTVGKMVDNFFENPQWKTFYENNKRYVLVTGTIKQDNKTVGAALKFEVTEIGGFKVASLLYNDVEQSHLVMDELMKTMCEHNR